MLILSWICVLLIVFIAGKLMAKIKMPSILGWLITGMILGPNAVGIMPQAVMDSQWYELIITWMQCAYPHGSVGRYRGYSSILHG